MSNYLVHRFLPPMSSLFTPLHVATLPHDSHGRHHEIFFLIPFGVGHSGIPKTVWTVPRAEIPRPGPLCSLFRAPRSHPAVHPRGVEGLESICKRLHQVQAKEAKACFKPSCLCGTCGQGPCSHTASRFCHPQRRHKTSHLQTSPAQGILERGRLVHLPAWRLLLLPRGVFKKGCFL